MRLTFSLLVSLSKGVKMHLVLDTCIDVFAKVANDRRCHATVRLTGFRPIKILGLISVICHDFSLMPKFNLLFERLGRFMYDAGAPSCTQQPTQLWPPSTSTHNLNFPG
jgi:hypothetical protein